jgi:uncharacterized membrane protein
MTANNALRAFGVGASSGLRTMTGPAFAFAGISGKWNWLFRAAALGEYIVDKLPATPARTQPIGLAARALAAGIAGAYVAGKDERLLGAACGVAGAMATAYLGVAYRKACLDRKFPAVASAMAEDGVAMALAWSMVPHKRG